MMKDEHAALSFDQTREGCYCSANAWKEYPRMKEVGQIGTFCSVWRAFLRLLEESIFPWSAWRRRVLFEKSRAQE